MKKIALAGFASVAVLALSACNSEPAAAPSDTATETVTAMPEEVMTGEATDAPTEAASEAM